MAEQNLYITFSDCAVENCRFCLHKFKDYEMKFRITPVVEQNYENLTKAQLNPSPKYPQFTCVGCNQKLMEFVYFRESIEEKQKIIELIEQMDNIEPPLCEEVLPKEETACKEEELLIVDDDEDDGRQYSMDSSESGFNENSIEMLLSSQDVYAGKETAEEAAEVEIKKANPYVCYICYKSFKRAPTLSDHISKIHLEKRNYFCDLCNYSSLRKNDMVRHLLRHVKREHRKTFDCTMCLTSLLSKEGLNRHMKKVHPTSKNICCSQCSAKFFRSYELNDHLASSHDTRQLFNCKICDKFFANGNQLKKHRRLCLKTALANVK